MLSLYELVLRGHRKPLIGSLARRPKYMFKPTKINLQRDSDNKVRRTAAIVRSKIPRPQRHKTWGSKKMK